MSKDEVWFKSIKWDNGCLECHKANNGTCPIRGCAEMYYDNNGNPIPASSVGYDGDYKEANNA